MLKPHKGIDLHGDPRVVYLHVLYDLFEFGAETRAVGSDHGLEEPTFKGLSLRQGGRLLGGAVEDFERHLHVDLRHHLGHLLQLLVGVLILFRLCFSLALSLTLAYIELSEYHVDVQ